MFDHLTSHPPDGPETIAVPPPPPPAKRLRAARVRAYVLPVWRRVKAVFYGENKNKNEE